MSSPRNITLLMVLALLLGGTNCAIASVNQPDTSPEEKLKQTDAVADKLIRRFHETLDFGVIFHEFFVRDPSLRKRAFLLNGYDEIQKALKEPVSDSLMQERFIAGQTAFHLIFEYQIAYPELDLPRGLDERTPYLDCPPHSTLPPKYPIEQVLKACVRQTNRKSQLFAPFLKQEVFSGDKYKAAVKSLESDERENEAQKKVAPVPRIEQGNDHFEIGAETPVYIVRKEGRDYYFVEEDHAFRFFYVDFLPNFTIRLF